MVGEGKVVRYGFVCFPSDVREVVEEPSIERIRCLSYIDSSGGVTGTTEDTVDDIVRVTVE